MLVDPDGGGQQFANSTTTVGELLSAWSHDERYGRPSSQEMLMRYRVLGPVEVEERTVASEQVTFTLPKEVAR